MNTATPPSYAFDPVPGVISVAIAGRTSRFPVHNIYCVGRNYAFRARDMGQDPNREPPFFFCKPADAILEVAHGAVGAFPYPPRTGNCQFEVELVAALGQGGRDIPVEQALDHVFGYAVGLDMTRRDLQMWMRDLGRPWDVAKVFDAAAPLAPIHPVAPGSGAPEGAIWLALNGDMQQRGDFGQMIWSVAEIIAALSTLFTLKPGDLIFTGTPEGVGPVARGDRMVCGIDGLGELQVEVV